MGLDQYVFKCKKIPKHINKIQKYIEQHELAYWRKNYSLHDWMEDLYYFKGGDTKHFNNECVELNSKDLILLKNIILDGRLEEHNYLDKDVLEFIERAIKAIDNGYKIVYYGCY